MEWVRERFGNGHPVLAIGVGLIAGMFLFFVSTRMSPTIALLAGAGLGVTAAVVINPAVGFLITALIVPLERFGRFTDDTSAFTISIMRLVGLLTLGAVMLHAMLWKKRIRFGAAFWLYALYTAMAILSFTYSSDPREAVRASGQIVGNLLFLFLILNIVRTYELGRRGVDLWLIATVVICLFTVYDWHFGDMTLSDQAIGDTDLRWHTVWIDNSEWEESLTGVKRAIGSTSHAAVYGINLILAVPFFVLFLSRRELSIKWKAAMFVGLVLVLYNVLLTNTRAVMLVAVFALGLCVITRLVIIRLSALLAAGLLFIAALPFIDYSIFERVLALRNYTYSESSTLRLRLTYWEAGLRVLEDHWLLGIGVGNTKEIPQALKHSKAPDQTTVHNIYLQILLETGVLGFLVFYTFVFLLLYYAYKAGRIFKERGDMEEYWFMVAAQIGMVAVLVYGLQCDVFQLPLKPWWLIAGLAVVFYDLAQRRQQTAEPEQGDAIA